MNNFHFFFFFFGFVVAAVDATADGTDDDPCVPKPDTFFLVLTDLLNFWLFLNFLGSHRSLGVR